MSICSPHVCCSLALFQPRQASGLTVASRAALIASAERSRDPVFVVGGPPGGPSHVVVGGVAGGARWCRVGQRRQRRLVPASRVRQRRLVPASRVRRSACLAGAGAWFPGHCPGRHRPRSTSSPGKPCANSVAVQIGRSATKLARPLAGDSRSERRTRDHAGHEELEVEGPPGSLGPVPKRADGQRA